MTTIITRINKQAYIKTIQILPKNKIDNYKQTFTHNNSDKKKTAALNNEYNHSNIRNAWMRIEIWCSSKYYTIN